MKRNDIIFSLSWANLIFIGHWMRVLSPPFHGETNLIQLNPIYETLSVRYATLAAIILWVILTAGVMALALYFIRRAGNTKLELALYALAALILLYELNLLRHSVGNIYVSIGYLALTFGRWIYGLCILLLFIIGWSLWRVPWRWVSGFRLAMYLCAPAVLVSFGNTLVRMTDWALWGRLERARSSPVLHLTPPKNRVVWMLFDRMPHNGVIENPVVPLPNFEEFKSTSFVATQVLPPATYTSPSIFSMISRTHLGGPVYWKEGIGLAARTCDSREVELDRVPDLFAKAKSLGARSSIVGWYLPYCRWFRHDVSECMRFPHQKREAYTDHFLASFVNVFRELTYWDHKHPHTYARHFVRQMELANQAVINPNLDFVFVHWPVPHPPWIYNADTHEITGNPGSSGGVHSNLRLADRVLGDVLSHLRRSNVHDMTTILVSSDHSDYQSGIAAQDVRVPLLIRLPGQKAAVRYEEEFNNLFIGDVILALLSDDIHSTEDLQTFLKARREQSLAANQVFRTCY